MSDLYVECLEWLDSIDIDDNLSENGSLSSDSSGDDYNHGLCLFYWFWKFRDKVSILASQRSKIHKYCREVLTFKSSHSTRICIARFRNFVLSKRWQEELIVLSATQDKRFIRNKAKRFLSYWRRLCTHHRRMKRAFMRRWSLILHARKVAYYLISLEPISEM